MLEPPNGCDKQQQKEKKAIDKVKNETVIWKKKLIQDDMENESLRKQREDDVVAKGRDDQKLDVELAIIRKDAEDEVNQKMLGAIDRENQIRSKIE